MQENLDKAAKKAQKALIKTGDALRPLKGKAAKQAESIAAVTGLDFARYQRPELVATALDLIAFIPYAIRTALMPLPILMGLLFFSTLGLTLWKLSWYGAIFYVLYGLPAIIFIGLPLGARNVVKSAVEDAAKIIDMTLDIGETVFRDQVDLAQKAAVIKPGEVLKGVALVVVLPSIEAGLRKRLRWFQFLARIVMWPVKKVVRAVVNGAAALIDKMTGDKEIEISGISTLHDKVLYVADLIRSSRGVLEKAARAAATGLSLPFTILTVFTILFNVSILAFIAYIFI